MEKNKKQTHTHTSNTARMIKENTNVMIDMIDMLDATEHAIKLTNLEKITVIA